MTDKWCKKHGHQFDENEGCCYCYEDYKTIEEFVKKLSFICYNMENRNWDKIDKLIKEYQEKLK